jgi:hypothetical protein
MVYVRTLLERFLSQDSVTVNHEPEKTGFHVAPREASENVTTLVRPEMFVKTTRDRCYYFLNIFSEKNCEKLRLRLKILLNCAKIES